MKKIIVLLLMVLFFIFNNISYTNSNFEYEGTLEINKQEQYKKHIDNIYEKLFNKLSSTSSELKLKSLENVSATIDRLIIKKKYSDTIVFMLNYLKYLAEEDIEKLNINVIDNIFVEESINKICNDNEHKENGECILNIAECNIDNGEGEKKWEGNYWGECKIEGCNEGFYSKNNSCIKYSVKLSEISHLPLESEYYDNFTNDILFRVQSDDNLPVTLNSFNIQSSYNYADVTIKNISSGDTYKGKFGKNTLDININAGEYVDFQVSFHTHLKENNSKRDIDMLIDGFVISGSDGKIIQNDFTIKTPIFTLKPHVYRSDFINISNPASKVNKSEGEAITKFTLLKTALKTYTTNSGILINSVGFRSSIDGVIENIDNYSLKIDIGNHSASKISTEKGSTSIYYLGTSVDSSEDIEMTFYFSLENQSLPVEDGSINIILDTVVYEDPKTNKQFRITGIGKSVLNVPIKGDE